jgi:iron only hydrogenase large subunit-like protein
MAGVLVKHYNTVYQLDEIYHCTVMPCFDKKLEASRQDFMNDLLRDDNTTAAIRDVDTVITTTELLQIISERCPVPFAEFGNDPDVDPLIREEGSSSDAYLHYVLHATIRSKFPHIKGEVRQIQGRNADHTEYHFVDLATGKVLLRFAAIYGFKNIQTFVIKEKRRAGQQSDDRTVSCFDFVEIMACPSGCLNGGGQLKPVASGEEPAPTRSAHKTHLAEMERVYRSIPTSALEDPLISQFFDWIDKEPGRSSLLQTQFRAVQDNTLRKTINVQW